MSLMSWNRVRSGNFQNNVSEQVGLSMDVKYECEAGYIWSILCKSE